MVLAAGWGSDVDSRRRTSAPIPDRVEAGDHVSLGSIQGALSSGRLAAERAAGILV